LNNIWVAFLKIKGKNAVLGYTPPCMQPITQWIPFWFILSRREYATEVLAIGPGLRILSVDYVPYRIAFHYHHHHNHHHLSSSKF